MPFPRRDVAWTGHKTSTITYCYLPHLILAHSVFRPSSSSAARRRRKHGCFRESSLVRLREAIFGSYKVLALSTKQLWFSSDSNGSDDEPVQGKKEVLKKKLSSLLASLEVESSVPPEKSAITLNLAKPQNRRQGIANKKEPKQEQQKDEEQQSSSASFPGIDENLVLAAKEVASSLKGDQKTIELELLQTLRTHKEETEKAKSASTIDVSEMFMGMKIDRRRKPTPSHRTTVRSGSRFEALSPQAQEVDGALAVVQSQGRRAEATGRTRVDLHKAPRLDIFNTPLENVKTDFPKNEVWDRLAEHELELLVKNPARNGFEEMIQWTEEGKLWVFPIDNEYGLEEKNVSFHEHVFLDHLLEGFPEKGPIRHFMELVITGLSKNPYITVERKKEHVEWYRQYFKDKEEILKEAGALTG